MGEQIENEDIKASFLTDHMILYINNPKHSSQKTLRNGFRKVAVYKINSHLWWLTMVEYAKGK